MTREAFKHIAEQAIEQLATTAEKAIGCPLPRSFCFSWMAQNDLAADGDIAEFLTHYGYVDESHIYPCWDLFLLEMRPDSKLRLMGYRAAYAPCPYGEHFAYASLGHGAGRVGPFKLSCQGIIDQFARVR